MQEAYSKQIYNILDTIYLFNAEIGGYHSRESQG